MFDAVAIGETLIDFTVMGQNEVGYPILSAFPGGAPANFLAAMAKYNCKTAMISKVGDDSFGRMLIRTMRDMGIDVAGMKMDTDVFTTLAFVTLDQKGDREFSFARKPGADTRLQSSEVDVSIVDNSKSVYFGTASMTDEPMRTSVLDTLKYAKERGKIIVFDPNIRKFLWKDGIKLKNSVQRGLQCAEIVKMSEDELTLLSEKPIEEAAESLFSRYPMKLLFVTLGERGCYYKTRGFAGYVKGLQAVKTVDTTGAGDIFTGSAMYWLLGKQTSEHLELPEYIVREASAFACAAAGLSTERPGGMTSVPSREEAEMRMKDIL